VEFGCGACEPFQLNSVSQFYTALLQAQVGSNPVSYSMYINATGNFNTQSVSSPACFVSVAFTDLQNAL
jgi:hypothetical protein